MMMIHVLPSAAPSQRPVQAVSPVWPASRWCGIAAAVVLIILSFTDPGLGFRLFWGMFVPLIPLMFLVAPGLWRNICPLAAVNQIPRKLAITRGLPLPPALQRCTPLIGAGLFLLIVPLRHVMLDRNGVAFGGFLLTVFCLSLLGGLVFRGKSGWCSQFCPMLQVERFYGQQPLVAVRDRHCRPCTGCTKSCYDLKSRVTARDDLRATASPLPMQGALLGGMMPWLILAFFTQPDLAQPTALAIAALYLRVLLLVATGIGIFRLITASGLLSPQRCLYAHVLAALNLFYVFVTPTTLAQLGIQRALPALAIQAGIFLLSVFWLIRAQTRPVGRSSRAHR